MAITATPKIGKLLTGAIEIPADYSELGWLMITVAALTFLFPMTAILLVKMTRLRSA